MERLVFLSASEHFAEVLKDACKKRNITANPDIEAYLVSLLTCYMHSHSLHAPVQAEGHGSLDTFAEMYLAALNLQNKEIMRTVGDRSLYLTGFFAGSLHKKPTGADYFMAIGVSAYNHLRDWTKGAQLSKVFGELASSFGELVDVLNILSHECMVQTEQDILKLYSFYLDTGSVSARDKLFELGVIPVPSSKN